jgi:hypothetical protein
MPANANPLAFVLALGGKEKSSEKIRLPGLPLSDIDCAAFITDDCFAHQRAHMSLFRQLQRLYRPDRFQLEDFHTEIVAQVLRNSPALTLAWLRGIEVTSFGKSGSHSRRHAGRV